MENLVIEKTKSTPQIELNYELQKIRIKGQSYPENAFNFYEPIVKWLDQYIKLQQDKLELELNIAYINTSSSKCLMDILDRLEEAHGRGMNIKLVWYCNQDNDSEIECAEEFLEDVTFEHRLITCSEEVINNM